jgi:signal transduction histidine kinase
MAQPPTIPPTHLRALSERIEQMREAERARIARELHDELGQLLTGLKLDFAATVRRLRDLRTPGDVVDRLQSAVGQVDIAIAMVRRIATDLRPAALDHRDLAGAIDDEARRVAARAGLRVRVTSRVDDSVPPELATAAFRIFQEALTNAVRHARATRITARLTTSRGRLRLFLRDNGVGLSEGPGASEHLGLLGMQERARSVGGAIAIRGREGRGTLVAVVLPLPGR